MEKGNFSKNLKAFWKWLWESESIWSYVVFLILVFILVKFIILPGLGLIMHTSLPLAIVESSSMDHRSLPATLGTYEICGKLFENKKALDKEEYWDACGLWYEQKTSITEEGFADFSFNNGFRKGDLMVIYGKKDIKIGDVIVFDGGRNHPIIHRVVSLNPLQTKGDHNSGQLSSEINIPEDKVIGTAVGKVPFVGWIKLFFVELFDMS